MSKIKIAVVGIGNCASSLIQGIYYYKDKNPEDAIGLMHWKIGDWDPTDIEVVAAFDIDARKVGKTLDEAIFAKPNCTTIFQEEIPKSDVIVQMGPVLDGVSEHMAGSIERKWSGNIAQLFASRFRRSCKILCTMCIRCRNCLY